MNVSAWLCLLCLLSYSQLLAQPFTSRTLSIQHGLPEYYVSGLVQDKAGFIWVATRDGLARYDGRHFKVYRHQPFGNQSLASNVILSLKSISDTTLLIHFEDYSCQVFNPVTEQFTQLLTAKQVAQSHRILATATLTANENTLWGRYGTQLTDYNRKTGQFRSYPFPQRPDPGNYYR